MKDKIERRFNLLLPLKNIDMLIVTSPEKPDIKESKIVTPEDEGENKE